MLNALQALREAATGKKSEGGVSDALHERQTFNNHLRKDASEVVSKLVGTLNKELKEVVEEMVAQANEFWSNQIHRQEETYNEEVSGLRSELASVQKQLDETVKMYNIEVQRLHTQLAEVQEQLDVARKVAEAKAAVAAHQQSSQDAVREEAQRSTACAVQELTKQLAAAQQAAQDAELKHQQKRTVLVQTVEKQHREIEELKQQLKKAEARDAKLTSVSEHLLSKQASMVATIKQLQDKLTETTASGSGSHPPQPPTSLTQQPSSPSMSAFVSVPAETTQSSPRAPASPLKAHGKAAEAEPGTGQQSAAKNTATGTATQEEAGQSTT